MLLENVNPSELNLFLECTLQLNFSWNGLLLETEQEAWGHRGCTTGGGKALNTEHLWVQNCSIPRWDGTWESYIQAPTDWQNVCLEFLWFVYQQQAPLYLTLPLRTTRSLPPFQANSSFLIAILGFLRLFSILYSVFYFYSSNIETKCSPKVWHIALNYHFLRQ